MLNDDDINELLNALDLAGRQAGMNSWARCLAIAQKLEGLRPSNPKGAGIDG